MTMRACCMIQYRMNPDNKSRIVPVVEIYSISDAELKKYQSMGVRFTTIKGNKLRVQGIQNCIIFNTIYNDPWFADIMKIYSNNKHTTIEGMLELKELHNHKNDYYMTQGPSRIIKGHESSNKECHRHSLNEED